jgi:hypothetical protein
MVLNTERARAYVLRGRSVTSERASGQSNTCLCEDDVSNLLPQESPALAPRAIVTFFLTNNSTENQLWEQRVYPTGTS